MRREDLEALTGRACYVADIVLPGMLHAAIYRSPYAHARIVHIDLERARQLPGVVLALSGRELPEWVKPMAKFPMFTLDPLGRGRPFCKWFDHYCLPKDKVRYEGEPVAVVVATSRYIAEDALELIEAHFEPLPPVTDAETALEPGSPLLYEEWGDNIMLNYRVSGGDPEAAFREADLIVSERLKTHRFTGTPMEPRGIVASYDPTRTLVELWDATQKPHVTSTVVQQTLDIPHLKVVVRTARIGGGFGQKAGFYPEEALLPVLAILTGRPVRWVETRREHMAATSHARQHTHYIEVAVKRDGTILGIRDRIIADIGAAYPMGGLASSVTTSMFIPGAYRVRNYEGEVLAVVTNKTPFGAHRGFGKSEAAYVIERMVDIVAERLGLDPAEVRFRNFIQPHEFPYISATGNRYDSGNYPEALRRALELADYHHWRREQERLRREGRYLGVGMALVIEPSSATRMGSYNAGYYSVSMRIDPTGRVYVFTSGSDEGQGHAESIAELVHQELGVPHEEVHTVEGDTLRCPYGSGSYSSRFSVVGSSAVILAARRLRDKLMAIAAHLLQEPEEVLKFQEGRVVPAGRPEHALTVQELAHIAYLELWRLPEGMEPGLEVTYHYRDPNIAYQPDSRGRVAMFSSVPYDAEVAVVEVDVETGRVKILKYVSVHDCGNRLNPDIAEKQHLGALIHGIGGALLEELVYDENGHLLSHTFKDYLIPSAMEAPEFTLDHIVTPNPFTPGGFKGTGETGAIGPLPVLANAVEDALRPLGVKVRRTPLAPHYLWEAIQEARRETRQGA